MKTIKVNQTILFGILGFLFLSVIVHYLIHNLDNQKTTELQVKALEINENTRQINNKLDGLDMSCPECPEQKDCPTCSCPEPKECPSCNCPSQNECPACNCPTVTCPDLNCPVVERVRGRKEKKEKLGPKVDENGPHRMDESNSFFSNFSLWESDNSNSNSNGIEDTRFFPNKCDASNKPYTEENIEGFGLGLNSGAGWPDTQ